MVVDFVRCSSSSSGFEMIYVTYESRRMIANKESSCSETDGLFLTPMWASVVENLAATASHFALLQTETWLEKSEINRFVSGLIGGSRFHSIFLPGLR